MTFEEILDQVVAMLQRRGRIAYSALKRQFDLDDDYLGDLKDALLFEHLVVDEEGKGLVWTGKSVAPPEPTSTSTPPAQLEVAQEVPPAPDAERRQLTVMFCDLADSTKLSGQLDPEDLRDVIRAYQETAAGVILRYEGHIAQYLGDGLLVYFGWPQAHEDDAQRAAHAGLGIIEAMGELNTRLEQDKGVQLTVRISIHTGPVVVGEMGGGGRHEQLALGETTNIAARLEGMAQPNTVVISDTTSRLVEGYFTCDDLGTYTLKGVATPIQVYRVRQATGVQGRIEVAMTRGLTPLVGREQEVGLLLERWEQVKEGQGQVVVLSGEAGIGKSRLVQVLKEHVAHDMHTLQECRCSPYHTQSALFPLIDLLQRKLHWQSEDTSQEKLHKLEVVLAQTHLDIETALPLFARWLSLPLSEGRYAPLTLSSQRQRQEILEALFQLFSLAAEHHPVVFILEDLHWVDPSTLEFLDLLLNQTPTTAILTVCTCRPEFQPPWGLRSYLTPIALNRFTRSQSEQMVERVTSGKRLPAEMMQQLVEKTDGVPLYVEEMTKAILESGVLREANGAYALRNTFSSLTIPSTLQDSLMARLDRLMTAKVIAQLGATIGRQFSYELLHAVSPLDEETLQSELERLVSSELVYQRGMGSQATYTFKHALIQDAAYESLLRSTRQQVHQRIAQVVTARFPETVETQPELVAHHYTEAGLHDQAIDYWQRAGEHAIQRSAHVEAIRHLTTALECLTTLPDTPERALNELLLQTALGPVLTITNGPVTPEVERVYTRARALCQQVGDTPQLLDVLYGLRRFYSHSGALQTARELAEQSFQLAHRMRDPTSILESHFALADTLFCLGELTTAHPHLVQGIALGDDLRQSAPALVFGRTRGDLGVFCRSMTACVLWFLGYPDQAREHVEEALLLSQNLSHPFTLAYVLYRAGFVHQGCREVAVAQERAHRLATLCREQGFALFETDGIIQHGWALAMQGQTHAGMARIQQGMAARRALGNENLWPYLFALLAEVHGIMAQIEAGLGVLTEALAVVDNTAERFWEAELHRLKGELLLALSMDHHAEAVTCFHRALEVARHQHAKSLELRAATSLARLWQSQGKRQDAHDLLAPVYGWFTEGFDTTDVQEAQGLLEG